IRGERKRQDRLEPRIDLVQLLLPGDNKLPCLRIEREYEIADGISRFRVPLEPHADIEGQAPAQLDVILDVPVKLIDALINDIETRVAGRSAWDADQQVSQTRSRVRSVKGEVAKNVPESWIFCLQRCAAVA